MNDKTNMSNQDQIDYWNSAMGRKWVQNQQKLD